MLLNNKDKILDVNIPMSFCNDIPIVRPWKIICKYFMVKYWNDTIAGVIISIAFHEDILQVEIL